MLPVPVIIASRTRLVDIDPTLAEHSHFTRSGRLHRVRFLDRFGLPWGSDEMFLDDIRRLGSNGLYRVLWE